MDNDHTTDEGTAHPTAALRVALLGEFDTSAAAEAPTWEVDGPPSGSALLIVKRGPNAGSRFLLDQPVTSAGRHPGSDLYLDDVTVGRRHAEFRRQDGQFRVVDTASLNGTYVNGKQLHSGAVLADGDQIQIGKFRLVFLARPAMG